MKRNNYQITQVMIDADIYINGGPGGQQGGYSSSGPGGPAGFLNIDASDVEVKKSIIAVGGNAGTISGYSGPSGGGGGKVNITSTKLIVTGNIYVNGGNGGEGLSTGAGGAAGQINLASTSVITISGSLSSNGGNGAKGITYYASGGSGGAGGLVGVSSANVNIYGTLSAGGGGGGAGCCPGTPWAGPAGAGGDSGNLFIATQNLQVSSSQIYLRGGSGSTGKGGNLTIVAQSSINIDATIDQTGSTYGKFFVDLPQRDFSFSGSLKGDISLRGSRNISLAGSISSPGQLNLTAFKFYSTATINTPSLYANTTIFDNKGTIYATTVDITTVDVAFNKITSSTLKARYCYDITTGSKDADTSGISSSSKDIDFGGYCKIPRAEIVAIKVYDTSQNAWRDYGDVFVLPTKDIEVLIEINNTGSVEQTDWFVGIDFYRYLTEPTSASAFEAYPVGSSHDLQVYYDEKINTGGNIQGKRDASCSLVSDPNNNGIFDVSEIITVKCRAPASSWGLVNISKEHLAFRVHERDLSVDEGRNGNSGNDWWTDALAKAGPLNLQRQRFEDSYPPAGWSGWGKRSGGYYSDYAAGTWLGFTYWSWRCTDTLSVDFEINEPKTFSFDWKLIRHLGDGYTLIGSDYAFNLYKNGVLNASASKGIGDWSRAAFNITEGSYTANWVLCGKQYDIESHEGLEALVDDVELRPVVDYDINNLKIYTFTKKKGPCEYDYHSSTQSPNYYSTRERKERYPIDLVGVECDTSNFYKQDTTELFEYYYGEGYETWYIGQIQEWWHGPTGYAAVGSEGQEGVNQVTNYIYTANCYSDGLACFAKVAPECINADTNPDPYDVSCKLYSSYPEGYSVTKKFCPQGTLGAPDDGCYPREYIQPSIEITSPEDSATLYANTTLIRGTASDSKGISRVEVSVNNESFEPASGDVSWEKLIELRPGPNTIVARATNTWGVTSLASITMNRIAVDMTPPSVSISYPEPHQKFENKAIVVSGDASDNVGVREVLVKLNYGGWEPVNGTTSWSTPLTLLWGVNNINVRAVDTSGGIAESSIVVYYYIPVYVPPLPTVPPRPEVPELIPTSPTTPVGSVTGVTTGLFNFTTSYEELLEAVDYQRRILDGAYDVAGRDVVYTEEVLGDVESASPTPNQTMVTANSTTLVWRFSELENGEVINLEYAASFDLLPLEKKNLSLASVNYTDGVTGARVHREFDPLAVEALSVVNLSINTSKSSYLPSDEFVLDVLLLNNGAGELRDLNHSGVIVTPTGEQVLVPEESITLLPPLGGLSLSRVLDKQRLLTPGNYTVSYSVADSRGIVLANSSTSFEVLRVVGAELDIGTDKPSYSLGETIGLFVRVNNTSPNTPLEGAEVSIIVSKNGSTWMETIRNVSTLARGSTETYFTYLAPNETGMYVANATLWLRNENRTPLDAANASFHINAVPDLALTEVLSKTEARALKQENATILVRNLGGGVAKNVSLLALLPLGFTPLTHKGSYINESNAIEWVLGDINGLDNTTRDYAFLTPFVNSYTPVAYDLRAKAFYADEGGNLYSASASENILVKPIPVIESLIEADKEEAYIGNELDFDVNLSNIGYDDAVNITAVVSLPVEMEVISYSNASYNASSNTLTGSLDIPPNQSTNMSFTAKALPITSINNLTFDLNVTYYDEDSYVYYNSSTAQVKVIPILVLAWSGDDSDEWFADNATDGMAYVKKVNTTDELMNELRGNYYNVLWLMNMGHCEYNCTEEGGLNSTEIDEIKTWLNENTSLTKELLFSDFTLKANPKLGDIAGFKYVGSLPMGDPYQPRNLTITESHYLTDGYEGANLSVVGWLDKIQPEYTYQVLAYADDILPTKEVESYPALTLSYYNGSRVIFFAADVGLSSYEGYNASVWLDVTRRALLWSTVPVEEVASLNVVKDVKPEDAKGKSQSAKVHVSIDLFGSGNLPAGNVSAAEFFSGDFTVDSTDGNATNTSVIWKLGDIMPWTSKALQCVLRAPEVNQTTNYTLWTIVNYTAMNENRSIAIPSNVTIEPKGGGKK